MTSVMSRNPAESENSTISPRAYDLADRLEQGARALDAFASALTDAQWQTPIPKDGRTVGVVVHHVASVLPLEIQLAQRLPDGVIHQYAPVDTPAAAARFLDYWRPSLGVFAESELWPNLIVAAAARGVRLALVSAGMS